MGGAPPRIHSTHNSLHTLFMRIRYKPHLLYQLRGTAAAAMNEFDKAIQDGAKVIQLQPLNTSGYYLQGYAHYMRQEYGKSADLFRRGLSVNPHDKDLLCLVQTY